jgi:hypothetical protein
LQTEDPQDPYSEHHQAPESPEQLTLPDLPSMPSRPGPVEDVQQAPMPEPQEVVPEAEVPKTQEAQHTWTEDDWSSPESQELEQEFDLPELEEPEHHEQNEWVQTEQKPEPHPSDDEYAEEPTPYLQHQEVIDEIYVDAEEFYNAMQDIKAMKREVRTRGTQMKKLDEVGDLAEVETDNVLKSIDKLQEDLIKIDTTLFEG